MLKPASKNLVFQDIKPNGRAQFLADVAQQRVKQAIQKAKQQGGRAAFLEAVNVAKAEQASVLVHEKELSICIQTKDVSVSAQVREVTYVKQKNF